MVSEDGHRGGLSYAFLQPSNLIVPLSPQEMEELKKGREEEAWGEGKEGTGHWLSRALHWTFQVFQLT
jgi:hypothetical protein